MKNIIELYEEFNNNSQRHLVQQQIKNMSHDQFDQSVDYFMEAFCNKKQEIKIFSIILFRNNYLDDNLNIKNLTQERCQYITQKLQEQMSIEDDKIFIKISMEVIVKLATLHGQEHQLFQFLNYQPQNEKQIAISLLFIQSICTYSFNNQELEKNYQPIQNLLQLCFQYSNLQLISFETQLLVLRNVDNDKMQAGFYSLIEKIQFFIRQKGQEGIQAMILLNEFFDKDHRLPKDQFEPLLNFYLDQLKTQLESQIIIQTMNGLRSIVERLDFHMSQYQLTFLIVQQLMDMIALIQDQEINNLSQNDISTNASETLQEFVQWLGPQYIYSILKSKILVVLEDSNWKLQHSGLQAIYAISQEITQQIDEFSSEELMNYIVPLQNSSNLVIINDILLIYGWFCYLYKPDLQFNEAEEIFEFLGMCFQNPQKVIQEKAVTTLKIYIENSYEDVGVVGKLIDNQDVLIQHLLKLIINDIRNPQLFRQISSVLNIFASTLQENLKENYYFQIKKIMTIVLQEIPLDTIIYQEIRTSAIESLGTLIFSINSNIELLRQEAFPTLNIMLQLYEKFIYDDPHHTAILYFIGQIAASMKDQFFHYHKTVLPLIFKATNLEIENQIPAQKMEEESSIHYNTNQFMDVENNTKQDNKEEYEIQEDLLNQIQLNKKLEAFNCLKQILQNSQGTLKKQQKDQVFDLFVQYLPYNKVKDIRNANAEILKVLLFTTDNNIDMADIFNKAYPHLNNIIQIKVEGSDIEGLCYFFNILNSCLKQFRNQLVNTQELSRTLLYASKSLSIYEKSFQVIEEKSTHILDKEKKENEENKLTDILDEVTSFAGYILEFHANQFENLICNNIAYLFCQILQTEFPLTKQINVACCFCCYAFEYLSEDIFQLFTKKIFKYFLSHGTKSQDVDIQQNICFGIGLVSKRMDPDTYKECRQICLTFLDFILEHKQAHTDKRMAITEIAIASLGKVALFQCHQDPKIREKLINKFLSSLPLKHEPEDSQELHQLVIDQIIQKNPAFVGCSTQTLKKLQSTVKSIRKYHEDHPELEILTDDAYYQIGCLDFSQLNQISG